MGDLILTQFMRESQSLWRARNAVGFSSSALSVGIIILGQEGIKVSLWLRTVVAVSHATRKGWGWEQVQTDSFSSFLIISRRLALASYHFPDALVLSKFQRAVFSLSQTFINLHITLYTRLGHANTNSQLLTAYFGIVTEFRVEGQKSTSMTKARPRCRNTHQTAVLYVTWTQARHLPWDS